MRNILGKPVMNRPPVMSSRRPERLRVTGEALHNWQGFRSGELNSIATNLTHFAMMVPAGIDDHDIVDAIRHLVKRHEILASRIREDGDHVFLVFPEVEISPIRVVDVDEYSVGIKSKAGDVNYDDIISDLIWEKFNYIDSMNISGELVRNFLIKFPSGDRLYAFVANHVICDRWSIEVLKRDFVYLCAKAYDRLVPLSIGYHDHLLSIQEWLSREGGAEALRYWEECSEISVPFMVEPDRRILGWPSNEKDNLRFLLSPEQVEAIQTVSCHFKSTVPAILLSAYIMAIYRLGGECDCLVKVMMFGRDQVSLMNQVGYYASFLPIRLNIRNYRTHKEYIDDVRNKWFDMVSATPTYTSSLRSNYSVSMCPTFNFSDQGTMKITGAPESEFGWTDYEIKYPIHDWSMSERSEGARLWRQSLGMNINATAHGWWGALTYSTDLYDRDTIDKIVPTMLDIISKFSEGPSDLLS